MVRNAEERRRRDEAVKKLEEDIAAGRVTVMKNFAGEVSISNWTAQAAAQAGWCEGCALVHLSTKSTNWVVKSKLAQAGVSKGKKFVAASHNGHSHGGK
jgi:hypothetical protein